MKSSDFKRILQEKYSDKFDDNCRKIIGNCIDVMARWGITNEELPEALKIIFDEVDIDEALLEQVTEFSHNMPNDNQHLMIFGVSEIYEKFFDNFNKKGRSLWLKDGSLNAAYKEPSTPEFWEQLSQNLAAEELPEIRLPSPPTYRASQFYEDIEFKRWYIECRTILQDWLDNVTDLFPRHLVTEALREKTKEKNEK